MIYRAVGVALALAAASGEKFSDKEWPIHSDGTVGPISPRVGYRKVQKAPGSLDQTWQKITNSPGMKGGYWANIEVNGRRGVVLSHPDNGHKSGKSGLRPTDKVVVQLYDGSGNRDFERDGGMDINLVPLKLERKTQGRASTLRASTLAKLEGLEDEEFDEEDFERKHREGEVFLSLGESMGMDPITAGVTMASLVMPWAAVAYMATLMPGNDEGGPTMESDMPNTPLMERESKSAPLKTPISAKIDGEIQLLKTHGDFEKFLAPAPFPFLFFPWGMEVAGMYYATAAAAAATTGMLGYPYAPFGAPFLGMPWMGPFGPNGATAATGGMVSAPAAPAGESSDAMAGWTKWYWTVMWWFHITAFWSLYWQGIGYFWMYWMSVGYPQWTAAMKKYTDSWKEAMEKMKLPDGWPKFTWPELPKIDPKAAGAYPYFGFGYPYLWPYLGAPAGGQQGKQAAPAAPAQQASQASSAQETTPTVVKLSDMKAVTDDAEREAPAASLVEKGKPAKEEVEKEKKH